jgi:hypothetical protein
LFFEIGRRPPGAVISLCFRQGAIEARRRPNHLPTPRFPSSKATCRKKTGMAASAAYLIALALTLLILVVLWEGFS